MRKRFFIFSFTLFFVFTCPLAAPPPETQSFEAIVQVPSPTGYEEKMVQEILKLLPAGLATGRDGMGSLYAEWGGRGDRLSLVTGIDEVGYVVSGFDERGYLHLFRAVSAPHSLYDSFQFGHPMTIWTESGPVSGVLALPSLHIASREMRNNLQNLFSIENALVDIGVSSESEAKRRGVAMLDPVTPLTRITTLTGHQKSGPALGTKVCTSILIDLAGEMESTNVTKAVTVAWLAQTKFPARRSRPRAALGAVVAREKLESSSYLVIDSYPIDPQAESGVSIGSGPVVATAGDNESELCSRILRLAASEGLPHQRIENSQSMIMNAFSSEENVAGLFIPLKFPDTPNEIVNFRDVEILKKLISLLLQ